MITRSSEPYLLEKDMVDYAINALIEEFDMLILSTIDDNVTSKIVERFISFHYTNNLHSFFVLSNLKNLTESFLNDKDYRDFILTLTDLFCFRITFNKFTLDELVNTIVKAVTISKVNKNNDHNSLLPDSVIDSLYINPEVLQSCLKDNLWLIVMYLLKINFRKTSIYSNLN